MSADAFIDGELLDEAKVPQGFSTHLYPAPCHSTSETAPTQTLALRLGDFVYELWVGPWRA